MPLPRPFLVGREAELAMFRRLVAGETSFSVLNIYGPGGIGKSSVRTKFESHARERGMPFACIDAEDRDLAYDAVLFEIMEGVLDSAPGDAFAGCLQDFQREFEETLTIRDILKRGGGLEAMFDLVGGIKESTGLVKLLSDAGKALSQRAQQAFRNRIALDSYLKRSDRALTESLATGLREGIENAGQPVALLIDTYERVEATEGLDNKICRTLVPALPESMKVVLFGRNALPRVNFDWGDFGDALRVYGLPELDREETKLYLSHYGLSDERAREDIYRFTGGYPLLLFLAVQVAVESGGWDKVGTFEAGASRDYVASKLLERILREERVNEVQAFLEKGVITPWFTPELVSEILEVGREEGRAIYEKLRRHSFVENHPRGLCFYEKIRTLLLERLKFSDPETYNRLDEKVTAFLERKSGILPEAPGGGGAPSG